MLSMDRARQFYLENRDKFPGMDMSEAVVQIARSGGMPAAAGTAQPMAPTVPATPVPVMAQVTPPMAVPEAAPQEEEVVEPEYIGPAQIAYQNYLAANPPAQEKPSGKVDIATKARNAANARLGEFLRMQAEAEQSAEVDPEYLKLIDKGINDATKEIATVDKDRQQAVWMAIAQAGLKMAQSQSPYFMQALASGMEAGLDGYSEAKAKAAEKKARLQEVTEGLALKKIEARIQAQNQAKAAALAGIQGAGTLQELESGAIKGEILAEGAPALALAPELANQQTRAQIANIYSTIGERAAAGRRADIALSRGRGGSGGAGGVKLSQINAIVNGAISENDRLQETLNDPVLSSQLSRQQKDQYRARIAENTRMIAYGRSLQKQKIGMGGLTFGQE